MCLERLEHNHQYNMRSISKNSGEIFLDRRQDADDEGTNITLDSFGPCFMCKTWCKKKQLWRHQKICRANSANVRLTTTTLQTLSDAYAKRMFLGLH